MKVSTVESLEKHSHQTSTYDFMYSGGDGPQTKEIKEIGNF